VAVVAAWPVATALFATAGITEGGSHRAVGPNSPAACVWAAVPTPDPHPLLYNRFDSVTAVSAREAWAVGDYFTGHEGGPSGAFIEHWDGNRWHIVGAPIPHHAILWSVSASGPRDVWAVGGTLIEHWDGNRWRLVTLPSHHRGSLFAVAARTPHDAWAVGTHNRGSASETLIRRWNGAQWSVVPSPNPPGGSGRGPYAILRSVAVISATDVWAAGYSGTRQPAVSRTLIEHWDGRRWTIVPSPNVRSGHGATNDILFSISGSRPDDVWAVGSWGSLARGYGGGGDHALALHWNGQRWALSATPALSHRTLLSGVLAQAGGAWAVGDHGLQPDQQTLAERWDGTHWTVVPSPSGFALAAVSTSADGETWAVGSNGKHTLAARCSQVNREGASAGSASTRTSPAA
jgi:hypothetical protein